ncbi:MAG: DUF1932 domain-containing protein [Streptosporangiales bacterium]|nr:DUF1932 domain-containing protein [Streptosporangiales bacterium]
MTRGNETVVGLLHPGEMGAAVGALLTGRGIEVLWASEGRGAQTRERADAAGLRDAGGVTALLERSSTVLSICPPHAAVDVAASAAGFGGVYVDANAVAPETAREIPPLLAPAATVVDGGIVGGPPTRRGTTRLYLSGPAAEGVHDLFTGTALEVRIVGAKLGAASAVKASYAAWTKGSAALLLATWALARSEGVEQALADEWELSQPALTDRLASAERSAATKGWRWIGEMEEIASAMRAAGLPDGFHRAAADVYRNPPTERR